jgi:hypothetical protein
LISRRLRRWLGVGACLGAVSLVAPTSVAADAMPQFALETLEATPAGDRFFISPDAGVVGHRKFYAKLFGAFAYKPLLKRAGRDIVSSELLVDVGASYAILQRILASADLPIVPYIGDHTPSAGIGDLRLSGRFEVFHSAAVDIGTEVRAWLPTGSSDALTGDGAVRAGLLAGASGRSSLFVYSASFGYLARKRRALLSSQVGPSLSFAAACGVVLMERLQIGLELSGSTVIGGGAEPFAGTTTPAIALLGARYRIVDWVIGAGLGPGLSRSPGVAPHVGLSIAWEPSERVKPNGAGDRPKEGTDTAVGPAQPPAHDVVPAPAPAAPPAPVPAPPSAVPAAPEAAPAAPANDPKPEPVPPPAPEPAPEGPPESPQAARLRARQLFADGVKAYDAGNYAEAASLFGKAYEIKPHVAVLRDLAQAELMSGQLDAACKHFKRWKKEATGTARDVREVGQAMKEACR